MTRKQQIEQALQAAFAPSVLDVVDDSERHRGHGGYQEGGESHFNVKMRARALAGLTRIKQHRAVHAALGTDLVAQIHALSLDLAAD